MLIYHVERTTHLDAVGLHEILCGGHIVTNSDCQQHEH